MPTIWWNEDRARLKSYGAVAKGVKATVKIEIEITDPGVLGFLLEDLARIESDQKRAAAPAPRKRPRSPEQREHSPALMLPYYGDRS